MNNETPGTEPLYAPEPVKTVERQGVRSEPSSHRYPQIRGGVCEWCGTLDSNVPPEPQYKLCPHFRGLGELRCSYCDETKDPTDVAYHSVLNVADHPDNPSKIIVWCNSYTCSDKHIKRFRRSS